MDLSLLENNIMQATAEFENGASDAIVKIKEEVFETINLLDKGKIRVAEKSEGEWKTNIWIKHAIFYYFKLAEMKKMKAGIFTYYDKIPIKTDFENLNIRVVPPATARYGSFIEEAAVLMPCYINIGARVGARSMIDTWATVGSCAQVGSGVHLSGGVGLGGVLEPASASPVIIEDGVFIGSRCIIVEGVHVGKEAVLASNVTLTSSTPIIDTRTPEHKTHKGYIPQRCVVLPGTIEKEIKGGKIYTPCAYIIGERKESTNKKTSLNNVLREFAIQT